jgi:hypothetical protein
MLARLHMLDEIGCTGAVETIDSTMLLSTCGMYSGVSALTHTSHRSGDQAQQRQLPRGISSSARVLTSVGLALLSEADALCEGIRLMQEGTRDHIVVETDAQELVSLRQNMSNHITCWRWRRF